MEPVALAADESVPDRPFTSVANYADDIAKLRVLIEDLCDVLRETVDGTRSLEPFERVEWRVDGLRHRIIICDPDRLLSHQALCGVGFFAERHTDVDIAPLEAANLEVVEEFPQFPGVLSYSSLELSNGFWANLVLHEEPDTAVVWRTNKVHADAVARLSPIHYRNVRIHNARLTDGLSGTPDIDIIRTKYWDYESGDDWHAIRELKEEPQISA